MTLRRWFAPGALLVSLVALAACGGGATDTAGKGRVAIVMSGAAGTGSLSTAQADRSEGSDSHGDCATGQGLQAANVTLSSILARTLDGILTDVAIALPVTVDVLTLAGGQDTTLPVGFLPPGTYDQLVVVMTAFEVTLRDGTKVAVTPPGGGWTAIVPVAEPFTVTEGETTTITLEFRRDLSFACGLGRWEFRPTFECHRGRRG